MVTDFILKRKRKKATYLRGQNISLSARKSFLYLLIIFVAHILLMMRFEGMSLGDAVWLTFTTATTVGYGDFSATTLEGRLSTIIILYMGGIFVLANFAGEYFEHRVERRKRMIQGLWSWNMADHLIIINTPARGGTEYFVRLVKQLRKSAKYRETPIQILTRQYPAGLPDELRELGVVHFHGYPDDSANLDSVNIADAAAIVVLAKDEYERASDALTFDILHRLKESGVSGVELIAECVDDTNRSRFINAGAKAVVRPVRAYPEILVRTLVAPGSEQILENLFQHEGDHTSRYDVGIANTSWEDIVSAVMKKGYGTAIAYVNQVGELICNPAPGNTIDVSSLIILVRSENIPSEQDVRALLSQ